MNIAQPTVSTPATRRADSVRGALPSPILEIPTGGRSNFPRSDAIARSFLTRRCVSPPESGTALISAHRWTEGFSAPRCREEGSDSRNLRTLAPEAGRHQRFQYRLVL